MNIQDWTVWDDLLNGIDGSYCTSLGLVTLTCSRSKDSQPADASKSVKPSDYISRTPKALLRQTKYHYHYIHYYLETVTSVVRKIPLGRSTCGGGMYTRCFPFPFIGSENIISSLPVSLSATLCSSFDIGPKSLRPLYIDLLPPLTSTPYPCLPRSRERVGNGLIFVSSSWSSYLWRVTVFRTVRLSPFVLMLFAVSRKDVKSGLKAGRQAARIPVFNSTLLVC